MHCRVDHCLRTTAGFVAAASLAAAVAACGGRQSDWEAARRADSPQAYTQFLQRYPDGDFTAQARARLTDLKQEADWKAATTTDTVQAYQGFLSQHPEGPHADEARIRVENFSLAQAPVQSPAAVAAARVQSHPAPAAAPLPTARPAAAAQSAAGRYRIQLGAFSTAARAQAEWLRALKQHPAQLSGLGHSVDQAVVSGHTLYRLQSSFVSEASARSICAALQAHKQACVVVLP